MNRIFMSLPDDLLEIFEREREVLGMNRSQYLRYLIVNRGDIRPLLVRNHELIEKLSSIELSLRVIAMKEELADIDRIYIAKKIEELNQLLDKKQLLDNLSKSEMEGQNGSKER